MFDGLLKPKWQHSDPLQRKAALESDKVSADVLATIARLDTDPEVRSTAVRMLDDLDLLTELLQTTELTNQDRDVVLQRLCELLARPLEVSPSLDQRLTYISRAETADLCARLAQRAQAIEVRTAALERVTDTDVLCAVAIDDAVASVRHMALERITDPAGWKTVSRDARNKDKKIARAAREKLDAHLKAVADQKAAEQLCDEMDTLLASDSLTNHSPALYQRLCKQWQEIGSSAPPQLGDRFSEINQKLALKIEHFETQIRERRAICTELEILLERIKQTQPDTSDENEDLTMQMRALEERWLSTDPERNNDNPVTQRFYDLQKQTRQASEALLRDKKRTAKQHELINQASELLEQGGGSDESQIMQLQQRWQKLDKPGAPELAEALQQEFDSKLRSMRERLKLGADQCKKALQQAEKLLPEMQQALQDGELERSLALRDRINHRLKLAKGFDKRRHGMVQKQLNRMRPKIDELRQWRHWGSDHAREHLLTEIEALTPGALGSDEIAARVRSARKAWQRIDRAEGPADEALWQRFDNACTRAYEPYQQQRKKQKEVMNQHLALKKQLCTELTAFEQNTDWGSVDPREVDHYIHEARKRWRRIGFVARKQGKTLEKDFQAVLELLDKHLAPERNRELRRRTALIARIEELSTASDLRAASREVKEAQGQWKPTVTLPRKEEQALWTRFRQACDAVYDRLRDERNSADEERQINLQRKQAICEQLETLLDQPDADYREIQKQFSATSDEWNEIRNIPRKQERAIDDRYKAIEGRIAERQLKQAKSVTEARLRALHQRSQLCARLEYAVLSQTMDESSRHALLAQVSSEWQALPAADAKNLKPLQARYELATRALQGDSNAQASLRNALAENLHQRLQLCLQLEVAAGVDSPAEYANERMKYQVSLLADSMQHIRPENDNPEDKITELRTAWLLAGPVEQEQGDKLETRFERALASVR